MSEQTFPHPSCRTPGKCREAQVCLDTWACSSCHSTAAPVMTPTPHTALTLAIKIDQGCYVAPNCEPGTPCVCADMARRYIATIEDATPYPTPDDADESEPSPSHQIGALVTQVCVLEATIRGLRKRVAALEARGVRWGGGMARAAQRASEGNANDQ